jgi:Family of unknown function (DUF6101)
MSSSVQGVPSPIKTAVCSAHDISFEATDPRADGRRRRIRVDAKSITIARRVLGMKMNLRVPSKCYRGVVLSRTHYGQSVRYGLRLDHRDPELSVPLCEAVDAKDVIAQWSSWADYLGLPRLIETLSGDLAEFDRALGRIRLGEASNNRRRSGTVGDRRPRFLVRRKTGRATPSIKTS